MFLQWNSAFINLGDRVLFIHQVPERPHATEVNFFRFWIVINRDEIFLTSWIRLIWFKFFSTVFVISIGYLAINHAKRLIYNYGAYNLDITGPLMVMVQRISAVAFSLHDGSACDVDNLSAFRKKYMIKKRPSIIEYFGYLFQFQSLLAGPYIMFHDYLQFIDGSNFKKAKVIDLLPLMYDSWFRNII